MSRVAGENKKIKNLLTTGCPFIRVRSVDYLLAVNRAGPQSLVYCNTTGPAHLSLIKERSMKDLSHTPTEDLREIEIERRSAFNHLCGELETFHCREGAVAFAQAKGEWWEARKELLSRRAVSWVRCYVCRHPFNTDTDPDAWQNDDIGNNFPVCSGCR